MANKFSDVYQEAASWPDDHWVSMSPEWDLNIWHDDNYKYLTLYPVENGYTITSKFYEVFKKSFYPEYFYYIDLDERGYFSAHVDDSDGNTRFSFSNDDLEDNECHMFTDGWMAHKHDMEGLLQYLIDMDIVEEDAVLKEI